MKKQAKKLKLAKETLRNLHNLKELADVNGGFSIEGCVSLDLPCQDQPVTWVRCEETVERC